MRIRLPSGIIIEEVPEELVLSLLKSTTPKKADKLAKEVAEEITSVHAWSETEIEFVKENYLTMTDWKMAQHLHHSAESIKALRLQQGLKKKSWSRRQKQDVIILQPVEKIKPEDKNFCLSCGKLIDKPETYCEECKKKSDRELKQEKDIRFNFKTLSVGDVDGDLDIRPAIRTMLDTNVPLESTMIRGVEGKPEVWDRIVMGILSNGRAILDYFDYTGTVKFDLRYNKLHLVNR